MLLVTLGLIAATAAAVYIFLIWNFDHWEKRGVKSPKPTLIFGSFPSALSEKQHIAYDVDEIYRPNKRDENFVGIFRSRSPQLLLLDPELVKRVWVNDFKHFHDNDASLMIDEKSDLIFAINPFGSSGEKWKQRRSEVTPGLTVSRIKNAYPITQKVVKKMTKYIQKQILAPPKDGFLGKDLMLSYSTEVVTDIVLGINAGNFSDKPTPIKSVIKGLFISNLRMILYVITVGLFPALNKTYKCRFVPKRVETFFIELMKIAIDMRRNQKEERLDFMNFLLQLQEKTNISTEELSARSMTFLLDGYDTTSDALSHCLLLIGRDQDVQEKLRTEFEPHLNENGEISFDTLSELPYLDACVHETIRMFPPVAFSGKICTEPIELTNKNGKTLQLSVDETVILPLYSIMNDEDYYPEPQSFKPERFLESEGHSLKDYRERGLYYGFGAGPRTCIGMRFALTQMKAAIVELVNNFNLRVNPKTRPDNTLDPKYFLTQLQGGIWLEFENRN